MSKSIKNKNVSKSTLKKHRERLEKLQDRLREVGTAVAEQARGLAGGESGGELSNLPFHMGDIGSEEYLLDMNALLATNQGNLAEEVRDALDRIDEGTFGTCEDCGQAISEERLDALPFARYCITCAEKYETPEGNLNQGRPRGPEDTLAPEGEMDGGRAGGDVHAAGVAGGGTSVGGLAGSNRGRGEPDIDDLQEATGSGDSEADLRHVKPRGRDVKPIDYESDEDRQRYAEETKAVE